MRSLRGRLTLSYAIVVAVVLTLLSLLACRIAFEVAARSMLDAVSLSVARAENAALEPGGSTSQAVARVIAAAAGPDVLVFAARHGRSRREPAESRPPDVPPPPGGRPPAPPGARAPEPPGSPFEGGGPAVDGPLARDVLAPLLGLRPTVVTVRGVRVVVAPDVERFAPLVRLVAWMLLAALAISIGAAWAIAARLARFAVAPIVSLTRELERFAAGDFTPRRVVASEGGELGRLIAAYNGAAAQVTSAFEERLEVEAQTRRFLADASHELRTPLTVIGGYLEILRKGAIDDAAVRERALGTLTVETRRMRLLVEKLLGLARLEQPGIATPERADVCAIARDAIAHVTAARGGRISLACAAPVEVYLDSADLWEAIANVVENAVKYGAGSAVGVDVSADAAGHAAEIRIRDGGPGIPLAERARVFERFYRGGGRDDVEGTGLGLAIVERALGRCGGSVSLEDGEPGRTTFLLKVPLAAAENSKLTEIRLH